MMFLLIAGGLDQMVPLKVPSDPKYPMKMQAHMLLICYLDRD